MNHTEILLDLLLVVEFKAEIMSESFQDPSDRDFIGNQTDNLLRINWDSVGIQTGILLKSRPGFCRYPKKNWNLLESS